MNSFTIFSLLVLVAAAAHAEQVDEEAPQNKIEEPAGSGEKTDASGEHAEAGQHKDGRFIGNLLSLPMGIIKQGMGMFNMFGGGGGQQQQQYIPQQPQQQYYDPNNPNMQPIVPPQG